MADYSKYYEIDSFTIASLKNDHITTIFFAPKELFYRRYTTFTPFYHRAKI